MNASAGKKHAVVFVGVGIFPHRVAGDKNFLLDLSEHLRAEGVPTEFVSIVTSSAGLNAPAGFTFVDRFMHVGAERHFKRDEQGRVIGYRHPHGPLWNGVELTATLVRVQKALRRRLDTYDRAVVHWIDSSLVMPSLRAVCGRKHRYVASVLRYLPQNAVGRTLRMLALRRAHRVFTGTEAARELLVSEGCRPDQVLVEPWGCAGRRELHVAPPVNGHVRLLWSGFLQQIGREDLLRTVTMARRVRQRRPNLEFTFCLKPECFTDEFAKLNAPGIEVRPGGPGFLADLSKFDAFLSPVRDGRSTPAPPLTWLEAFAAGVPVITTVHRGVEEVVRDGRSGIVGRDYDDLENRLLDHALGETLGRMRRGAREEHARRYEIGAVASRYAAVYRTLFRD